MTINDILSKKLRLDVFYKRFLAPNGTTVVEAEKEPLKLADLQAFPRTAQINLESGEVYVRWGEAFCFCCIENLIGRYNRPKKPSRDDIARMARLMIASYSDWSVLDLPTFVDMVVRSRIPSLYNGGSEYSLVTLDEPNIMGKVESYDKMRPNAQALQGISPAKASALQQIQPEHYGMLMDGTPYDFRVPYDRWVTGDRIPSGSPTVNAERYWRGTPHNGEEDFERFYANYRAKLIGQEIVQPVNKVLGLQ